MKDGADMFTLEQLKNFNEQQNGNHSILAKHFGKRLDVYGDMEIPFREEFLFFEDKYLPTAIDLKEKNINLPIIDIGCQYGFQSELFKNYTGIEIGQHRFFNKDREGVQYIQKSITDCIDDLQLDSSIVLSIMSLGYFNTYISKEKSEHEVNEMLAKLLSKSHTLYIATTEDLHNEVNRYFKSKRLIYNSNEFSHCRNSNSIGEFSVWCYEH